MAAAGTTARLKSSFSYAPQYPAPGQAVQFTDASTGEPIRGSGSSATVRRARSEIPFMPSPQRFLSGGADSQQRFGDRSSRRTISVIDCDQDAPRPLSGIALHIRPRVKRSSSPTRLQGTRLPGYGTSAMDRSVPRNPSHVFATIGFKTVTLTTTAGSGTRSVRRRITVVPGTWITARSRTARRRRRPARRCSSRTRRREPDLLVVELRGRDDLDRCRTRATPTRRRDRRR